jgi:hypothetical protein
MKQKQTNKHRKKIGGLKNKTKRVRFERMNCSPAVKGKTPVAESCFTPDVLEQIKEAYNKHHETSPIHTTDPKHIWTELKNKLSTCQKEDCWLDEIKDAGTREKLDEYIFAPDKPKEWEKNKSTWLSNYDIFEVLRQYQISHKHFKVIGPTPIDFDSRPKDMNEQCVWEELCNFSLERQLQQKKTKLGIVFNLDKHDQGGSHWVSMFVDIDNRFIFYFDSAGEKIKPEIDELQMRIRKQAKDAGISLKFYENHPFEHQMGENECGMYSLFFIITMLTGQIEDPGKPTKIFKNHNAIIRMFKKQQILDRYMNKYRNIFFNTQ